MAAFVRACAEDGAQQYTLQPSAPSISGMASSVAPPDMTDVPAEYHNFADVFSDTLSEKLPEHRPYDLKINIEEGTSPPLGPIYSLSEYELKALHEFIDDNLCSGFITPSCSPHRAPVLFVKKKTSELRLCIDFCGLNKISKKDRYPLPLISDLLDSARSARIYTKLDLRHAYHLVCIAEGDEWKTAFRTRYSSFEWHVMPFGLTNAPVVFQRFVNDVFADMLDVSIVVYLNDILIYSNDPRGTPTTRTRGSMQIKSQRALLQRIQMQASPGLRGISRLHSITGGPPHVRRQGQSHFRLAGAAES